MTTLREVETIVHLGTAKIINVSREKVQQHHPEYADGRVLFDYRQNGYEDLSFKCIFTVPLNGELAGTRSISLTLNTDDMKRILGESEWKIVDEYYRHFDLYFGDGTRLERAVYRNSWPSRHQKYETTPDLDLWNESEVS
jgi:hypothetical protein